MKQNDYQDILHPYIRLFLCSFFACMAATLKVGHNIKVSLSAASNVAEQTKLFMIHEHFIFLIMYFAVIITCTIVLHERYYQFKKNNPVFLLSLGYNHKDTPPYHVRFGECLWVISTIFSIALLPAIVLLDLIYRVFPTLDHMPLSQLTVLIITNMPCAIAAIFLCLNKEFIQLYTEKASKSDKKTVWAVFVIYLALHLYVIFGMNPLVV